jgi:hypothetical protein
MKWIGLAAGFCVLVVATGAAWNRRFEPVEGRPEVQVEGGKGGRFVWEKQHREKPVALRKELPLAGPVGILHVRFSWRAVDLIPGGEKWEDGRLLLDWVDQAGGVVAHDSLMTMKGTDKKTRSADMIVRSVGPGLVPVLRVEHLGLSGRMEIHSLQAVAVRERGWVGWVAGGLLGVWGLWCCGFVRSLTRVAGWRVLCGGAIVLLMGWFLVVPGPWAHERPLAGGYQMGPAPDAVKTVVMAVEGGMAQVAEPLGKMPVQGSWMLWVKQALSFLRPVLHLMLFAGPAFVMAGLCGARCAWWSGVLASCAVEAGQAAFGYGFDWLDGIDLLVDWAGIAAAIWVWGRGKSYWLEVIGYWGRMVGRIGLRPH